MVISLILQTLAADWVLAEPFYDVVDVEPAAVEFSGDLTEADSFDRAFQKRHQRSKESFGVSGRRQSDRATGFPE